MQQTDQGSQAQAVPQGHRVFHMFPDYLVVFQIQHAGDKLYRAVKNIDFPHERHPQLHDEGVEDNIGDAGDDHPPDDTPEKSGCFNRIGTEFPAAEDLGYDRFFCAYGRLHAQRLLIRYRIHIWR